jgi:hypothetical protein
LADLRSEIHAQISDLKVQTELKFQQAANDADN